MYIRTPSTVNPLIVIFLIDQSRQMSQVFQNGKSFAEEAALLINQGIDLLVSKNLNGLEVKNRAIVCCIGYGSPKRVSLCRSLTEWTSLVNEFYEIDNYHLGKFVKPVCSGEGRIEDAFSDTLASLRHIFAYKPTSPAPWIIHVSSGLIANRISFDLFFSEINQLKFIDGKPLFFNVILTNSVCENLSIQQQPRTLDDAFSIGLDYLYNKTSDIPNSLIWGLQDFGIKEFRKGFIVNGQISWFLRCIHFGSAAGRINL